MDMDSERGELLAEMEAAKSALHKAYLDLSDDDETARTYEEAYCAYYDAKREYECIS